MRVLVADDNREIRSALHLALLEVCDRAAVARDAHARPAWACCTIFEADSAVEAIRLLKRQDIDVMLLDWELPGFDASDVLPQIRADAPGCTVIAMSGRPEARDHSLRAGVDYFVGKNDPPSRLLELLRGLWTSTRPRAD